MSRYPKYHMSVLKSPTNSLSPTAVILKSKALPSSVNLLLPLAPSDMVFFVSICKSQQLGSDKVFRRLDPYHQISLLRFRGSVREKKRHLPVWYILTGFSLKLLALYYEYLPIRRLFRDR